MTTNKARIEKLEKHKTQGGFTWREFVEGRAQIDPEEWQKFVEANNIEWERSHNKLAEALGITRSVLDKELEALSNDKQKQNSKA